MKIDKPTIASELIIEATEMKCKRPTQLTFEELVDVIEGVVKKLTISAVSKSFTADEVVSELEDCDTLDDAIMFFNEQKINNNT